jgi:putative transposase
MALLSFVDPTPRAYRLQAGNADLPISTMGGTSPGFRQTAPQTPAATRRHLAFGRGFHPDHGTLNYLWRAVDQHGVVLDILVQDRRNATAAKRFFKRLLRGLRHKPRRLITDGLRSYGVAQRDILPDVRHRTSRYLNNRAENSHRPTRRRERQMQRFKSPQQAQRFLSAHGILYGHFRPRRHLMTAGNYRRARAKAFRVWQQETCVQIAA